MLEELSISNLAIIDRLDVRFDPGFNVLTGETGAVLGRRVSAESNRGNVYRKG